MMNFCMITPISSNVRSPGCHQSTGYRLSFFYYEGLAYYQIAEELKCSEGKIKTDIFRAKKMLKEKMESGANEQ